MFPAEVDEGKLSQIKPPWLKPKNDSLGVRSSDGSDAPVQKSIGTTETKESQTAGVTNRNSEPAYSQPPEFDSSRESSNAQNSGPTLDTQKSLEIRQQPRRCRRHSEIGDDGVPVFRRSCRRRTVNDQTDRNWTQGCGAVSSDEPNKA